MPEDIRFHAMLEHNKSLWEDSIVGDWIEVCRQRVGACPDIKTGAYQEGSGEITLEVLRLEIYGSDGLPTDAQQWFDF